MMLSIYIATILILGVLFIAALKRTCEKKLDHSNDLGLGHALSALINIGTFSIPVAI